jgi:hypothetical protein
MTGGRDELAQLLERAGLEILGEAEDVLPPRAAWRTVIAGDATPTVAVQDNRPDLVAEINAQWRRLATEHRIVAEDGVFLIDVAGDWTGGTPRRWMRVRLTAKWDLAGVLGDRPGQPEFLTLSTDGDTLLAVTTEEYDVWLIAVDGLRRRQEAAAQAAAQETPREREHAWASLLQGPRPTKRLLETWAHGLARHPTAPDDVLHSLLGHTYHLLWRRLPASIVDAAIGHPEWKVRELLADAQPDITAEQWSRLILAEQDSRHRWILTSVAADRRAELTETAYQKLTSDPSSQIRTETARLHRLPAHLLMALAADVDPQVRASACEPAWPHLDGLWRQKLLTDPTGKVRAEALLRHHQDQPLSRAVFEAEGLGERVLETCRLERDLAEQLARHGERAQRRLLAHNPQLPPDLLALLARDPDASVRFEVSTRPDLSKTQRAEIRIEFDPSIHYHPLEWVVALHDDPDAMRRLAASSHPLVRRSVARARHLPPDVLALLAQDEDRIVHLFLAESCDDAPADMLMEVWQWWTGSLTHPDCPHGHPNFPRSDLLRYADDPNPRMRQLAIDDLDSTAELVEEFSHDTNEEVRRRAATDPRLTAASAVRLLDDPCESVRRAAAMHPRLPARVLIQLLRDDDTAEIAAKNPSLPVNVMRWMVQLLTA